MSNRQNDLAFARGETYFNGGTVDSTSGQHLQGREYEVHDERYAALGLTTKLRILRNNSGFVLEGKRLITPNVSNYGLAEGYADVHPEHTVPIWPVDDYYTSTIPHNDLFYAVVEGPCNILTGLASDATNVITAGDWMTNATGESSGATTSGRIRSIDSTGATTPLAKQLLSVVGRAMTARTTTNVNTATLVLVGKRW